MRKIARSMALAAEKAKGFVKSHKKGIIVAGVTVIGAAAAHATPADPTTVTTAASSAFDTVTTLVTSMVSFGVIVGIVRKIHMG